MERRRLVAAVLKQRHRYCPRPPLRMENPNGKSFPDGTDRVIMDMQW